MQPTLSRLYWIRLLSVALLVRIVDAFIVFGSMPFISDARSYSKTAQALLRDFPGAEAFYWPPGQPMFLAGLYTLFGTSPAVPRLATIILNVLCVVLTVLLSRQVLKDDRSVRFAGWIAALYPPSILMSGQPYSQPLASVAILLTVYLAWRGWKEGRVLLFALSGVALGVGILTRSSMLSLVPVLGVIWLIMLRRARHTDEATGARVAGPLLGGLLTVAAIIPVFLFNHSHNAGWNISTNNEANFFVGNCPYTHFYKTSHLSVRDLNLVDSAARAYIMSIQNRPDGREAMMKASLEYIIENPGITIIRTLSRIRTFWGFDYVLSREIQEYYNLGIGSLTALLAFESGGYVLVGMLIITGLFLARDRVVPMATKYLLWVVIAYQIPYMISYAAGNYHFPVVWLLIPFGGAGLARIVPLGAEAWEAIKGNRRLWIALIVFILVQVEYAYWVVAMSE